MSHSIAPSPTEWRPRRWLLALACLLAVFGARVAFVDQFGTDLPTWDQWGAEGESLILPYEQGRLRFIDLFHPHNEHRVVATKLLALGLYVANGQWDARLECVVNAAMMAAFVGVFFLFGRTKIPRRWDLAWIATLIALFAAPLSWQNILGGFHTQQTFLIAFSFAAIAGLTRARPLSAGGGAGGACAVAALFTMGSGLLAAAAAGATLVATSRIRSMVRRHGLTLAVCTAVVGLGLWLHVSVPYHDHLKAQSVWEFVLCFWRSLQWPQLHVPVHAVLSWLPWGFLTWGARRSGDTPVGVDRLIAGAGFWVLLQFAASAYARGADGAWPADRYLDTVAFGIAINVLALLILLARSRKTGWPRRVRAAACVIGAGFLIQGWWMHVHTMLDDTGPALRAVHIDREQHTRAYVLTGDPAWLKEGHIPYPQAGELKRCLDYEELRRALPASARTPLGLSGVATPEGSFAFDAIPEDSGTLTGWPLVGSMGPSGARTTGTWQSAPFAPARFGYWVLPTVAPPHTAADLGIHILEGATRREIDLRASNDPRLPRPHWDFAVVPAPAAEAVLVAHDFSPDAWLGFGAPVEMATGSFLAWQVTQAGLTLFWIGLAAVALVGAGLLAPKTSAGAVIAAWRRTFAPLSGRRVVTSSILAGLAALVLAGIVLDPRRPAYFVATIHGDLKGNSVELFYDRGRGLRGTDSAQCWFDHDLVERHIRLRLPSATYRKLRFDPMDFGATTIVERPRIEDADGRVLRELAPESFVALRDIADVRAEGRRVVITAVPEGADPQLVVRLDPELSTVPVRHSRIGRWIAILACGLIAAIVAPPALAWLTIRHRARAHPTSNSHPA